MERNTYIVGKDVQRMQSKVIKGMSKDEDENKKESNDIGDEDEKTDEEWAQFNLVDFSMYL